MLLAEDLLLLATDDDSGKRDVDSTHLEPALGGAALLDLVLAGRAALEGEGRKARVVVADGPPVEDPVLDGALRRLAEKAPVGPQSAVKRLAKGLRDEVYDALAARGIVRREHTKVLGLIPSTKWPATDSQHEAEVRGNLVNALVHGQDPDAYTGALIGVLHAADMVKKVVDKPDVKAAKARAEQLAEGNWASAEVRKAIKASQAAMTAAIVVATTAGATAGT